MHGCCARTEKQSPLHLAVVRGWAAGAARLLAAGARPGARDASGRTPLHLAAYDDRLEVMRALLDLVHTVHHLQYTYFLLFCKNCIKFMHYFLKG